MKTITITKADLDADNFYAASAELHVEGDLIVEPNLGCVCSKKGVSATLSIIAQAGSGIKAGSGIEAGTFVFSFQFYVRAKWIETQSLPFWREYWAEMSPLKPFAVEIRKESNCWNSLRALVSPEQAKEICAWEGWHPLLRAHLEMFFGLKKRVTLDDEKKKEGSPLPG